MFWFKSCSRCNGDLYEGNDVHGRYVACLQCGDYLTPTEEAVLRYSARPVRMRTPAGSPLGQRPALAVQDEAAVLVSVG